MSEDAKYAIFLKSDNLLSEDQSGFLGNVFDRVTKEKRLNGDLTQDLVTMENVTTVEFSGQLFRHEKKCSEKVLVAQFADHDDMTSAWNTLVRQVSETILPEHYTGLLTTVSVGPS